MKTWPLFILQTRIAFVLLKCFNCFLQTLNYDLTKGYLDLVVTYVILMILLSRVEDRKAVLGLFHVAQEMANNPT